MELVVSMVLWILTVLIPINGLLFIGARNERLRNRRIAIHLWRSGYRRKS